MLVCVPKMSGKPREASWGGGEDSQYARPDPRYGSPADRGGLENICSSVLIIYMPH